MSDQKGLTELERLRIENKELKENNRLLHERLSDCKQKFKKHLLR